MAQRISFSAASRNIWDLAPLLLGKRSKSLLLFLLLMQWRIKLWFLLSVVTHRLIDHYVCGGFDPEALLGLSPVLKSNQPTNCFGLDLLVRHVGLFGLLLRLVLVISVVFFFLYLEASKLGEAEAQSD
jgi:hypothetical protein